jgi:NAD(P)-dependent dehydrogenase (short-subunit alcohol dehydrogenase family)
MHINNLFALRGFTALVVGGAGKIGFPMSESLAEAGAKVYIGSRDLGRCEAAAKRLRAAKLEAIGIQIDQADEVSVGACLSIIKAEAKAPDILVNCGVERPMKRFFNDDVAAWDRSMTVNARGLFLCCRTFGREMAEAGGGSIINVASIYGLRAPDMTVYEGSPFETEPDYPYTKGGMIMFSKYLASYWAKRKVRVNCVAPGGFYNRQPEPFLSKYIHKVPLGRMAEHDDLKGVTVFLASRASAYITGAVIPVDGGFTVV